MKKLFATSVFVSALLLALLGQVGGSASIPESMADFSLETTGTSSTETTTPPVVIPAKTLALDARRLLFGRVGDQLQLNVTTQPADATRTTLTFSSTRPWVASVDAQGKVTAKGLGNCLIIVHLGNKIASCDVTVADKWVAITWDDGPGQKTPYLLSELKKRKVPATFFLVGSLTKSRSRQELVKRMAAEGHEVANHTWSHDGSAKNIKKQLKMTNKSLRKALDKTPALMRPPGGGINEVTRKCGKPIILWSVDPKDWRDRNADTVCQRIVKRTRSGSIVLLHDIHPTSVTGGLQAIDKLKMQGYTFVTVSEMLPRAQKNKVYFKGPAAVRTMKIQ